MAMTPQRRLGENMLRVLIERCLFKNLENFDYAHANQQTEAETQSTAISMGKNR